MNSKIPSDVNGRVNSANLSVSDQRIEEELEIRMSHLSEIALDTALLFCRNGVDGDSEEIGRTPFERSLGGVSSAVVEYFSSSAAPERDHKKTSLPCHAEALKAYDGVTAELDRVYYVERLVGYIEETSGRKFRPADFFLSKTSGCDKVRFVGYGDMEQACRRLSRGKGYEPIREDSLEEACCEAVEEGGFAVIPWRNSRDGVLRLFSSLVGRYDLRAHLSCRVDRSDSFDFSEYILVSSKKEALAFDFDFKSLRVLIRLKGEASDPLALARLTLAFDLLGAKIENSDSASHDGRERLVLLCVARERLCALLAYITLFVGGTDTVVGIFGEI